MALLEIHDKPFNYLLQVENLYNKAIEKFDLKTKGYFDALRELRDNYNKEYEALDAKANQLIYGNSEGKLERDRSDLYIKVVQRSEKYKTWKNFFTAIGGAAAFILLVKILCYFLNVRMPFTSVGFENFVHMFLITAAWSGLIFDGCIFFKSFKYLSKVQLNTREERKWLKKYFKSIGDIITAKSYLNVLVQREETVERYIDSAERAIKREDSLQKIIESQDKLIAKRKQDFDNVMKAKNDAIYNMKKDIEKVMDDFIYDAEINTVLDHVLESWKDY